MKKILKFTALTAMLLILIGTLVSCKDKENPVEIPFTHLSEILCHFGHLHDEVDAAGGKVIIINNNDELAKHAACVAGVFIIDFSQYTLLLALGVTTHGSFAIPTRFVQKSNRRYILEVTRCDFFSAVMTTWGTFALVPKISNRSQIELVVHKGTHPFCLDFYE